MTFTTQHRYLSVIGAAYNNTEKWQFGLRLTDCPGTNDAIAAAAAPIFKNWWTNLANFAGTQNAGAPNTHELKEIKVATVDVDGTYPPNTVSSSFFYPAATLGPNVPPTAMLPQASVAATLLTAIPRGRGSKGRIFLPPSTWATTGADGRMTPVNAGNIANGVKNFILLLNAEPSIGSVAVMSRGKAAPLPPVLGKRPKYTYPNPGTTAIATSVRVGLVVDTQRRRRRALAELPVTVVIA